MVWYWGMVAVDSQGTVSLCKQVVRAIRRTLPAGQHSCSGLRSGCCVAGSIGMISGLPCILPVCWCVSQASVCGTCCALPQTRLWQGPWHDATGATASISGIQSNDGPCCLPWLLHLCAKHLFKAIFWVCVVSCLPTPQAALHLCCGLTAHLVVLMAVQLLPQGRYCLLYVWLQVAVQLY
jgi:hypothetical protein